MFVDPAIAERVDRLELRFNDCGVDPYGISSRHLAVLYTLLGLFYRRYFSVRVFGLQNVPGRGRAMLVGNHSGGLPLDAAMVIASLFFDMEPPRLGQAMAEKFLNRLPFGSLWSARTGHFTGLPELAARLLRDERMLLVFPEGAKGTAKLEKQSYDLVDFGTGFMRLALETQTPIIPFSFAGGGSAIPTIRNSKALGKLFGAPYFPITRYGLPLPRPVSLDIDYGEPMVFQGNGSEEDDVIRGYVATVRDRIAGLLEVARARRVERAKERP